MSNVTYEFPININSITWQYTLNSQSMDTIGGRVIQLLSVQVSTMQVTGETGGASSTRTRGGGRRALLELYAQFKQGQDDQNLYKKSLTLSVPSAGITQAVWLQEMQIGWDYTTASYPYQMMFQVEQDFSTTATQAATSAALDQLQKGVGFSLGYTGFSKSNVNISIQDLITQGVITRSK